MTDKDRKILVAKNAGLAFRTSISSENEPNRFFLRRGMPRARAEDRVIVRQVRKAVRSDKLLR